MTHGAPHAPEYIIILIRFQRDHVEVETEAEWDATCLHTVLRLWWRFRMLKSFQHKGACNRCQYTRDAEDHDLDDNDEVDNN